MFLFGPPNVDKMKARRDVEGLIKALSYRKDSAVRQAAAMALGEIKDASAVEPLIIALKDEHGHVRELSARALGQIGDARAVEPLIAVLSGQDYEYVREAAAEALGKIGDTRAVEPLMAALQVWGLSKAAALALDRLGWQPGQDETATRYWLVKQEWEKCAALGSVAANTCLSLLEESARLGAFAQSMLHMDYFSHPAMGWGVIGWLEGKKCVEMRESAVKVLVKIGAPAVPLLIDRLGAPGAWTKMTIAWALGELKDARAVASLMALLKDKKAFEDGDCSCDCPRQAVVEALVKIGKPAVEPLLEELANEEKDIRERVVWALGEIGDARAVEPLIALLEDWSVRSTAAESLKKLGYKPK